MHMRPDANIGGLNSILGPIMKEKTQEALQRRDQREDGEVFSIQLIFDSSSIICQTHVYCSCFSCKMYYQLIACFSCYILLLSVARFVEICFNHLFTWIFMDFRRGLFVTKHL
ncbi:hypothetical protein Nepgr_020231 [Nepenthes gracilis]|uniref:Uncharacterized protein n=1 Tax=Nepenthes gracilis TaxID=150966 RepID=A0AAD3XVZ7_NEPGR|nr:hypothetical protein Nepgr_020231 [Nepenthes gracilis]